jgi:type III secretory pathway component EscS
MEAGRMLRSKAFWLLLALLALMPAAVSAAVRDLLIGVVQAISTLLAHMPHQPSMSG